MRNALIIAWREFAENAKTRGFWFGILLFPLIWIVTAQIPRLLAAKGTPTRHFVIVDLTGRMIPVIESALQRDGQRREALAFREWAADNRRSGVSAQQISLESFDLQTTLNQIRPQLQTNAGTFTPPKVKFRRVAPPASIASLGDLSQLEVEVRAWLRGGLAYQPRGMDEEVSLFAVAIIVEETTTKTGPALRFWSENQADTDLRELMEEALSRDFRQREYVRLGLDQKVITGLETARTEVVNLSPRKAEGEERVGLADLLRQWAPSGFVYLLWVAVFSIAQMLLNSVIEEKSNRIIEVLLSSVTSTELMAGKLIGIAAVGLVMIASWIGTLLVVMLWLVRFGGMTSQSEGALAQVPLELMTLLGDSWILPAFLLYFFLGYILYAGVILAIGSTCDTLKDAQNYMGVIVLLMMVPLVALTFSPRDPNGPVATFLSWIPFYTPFVMMNRVAAGPPLRDILGTLALLVVMDVLVIWGCGRIFRAAVLRTGQPASLVQIWRWLVKK